MKKSAVKKSLKVAGAFAAATGVVVISALVASGAAVGAVAEGFKEAGKVVKKSLENAEKEKITEDTTAEEMNEETIEVPMTQEVVKTQTVQAEGETVIESV